MLGQFGALGCEDASRLLLEIPENKGVAIGLKMAWNMQKDWHDKSRKNHGGDSKAFEQGA
jgi:hypothetical protein